MDGQRENKKPKFKPVITRIKLNPEQAVLQCSCYDIGVKIESGGASWGAPDVDIFCGPGGVKDNTWGGVSGVGSQSYRKTGSTAFS